MFVEIRGRFHPGACLAQWQHPFDRSAYFDATREQSIARAERNEVPLAGETVPAGFPWKRIYYVEYPMLNRHKKRVLKSIYRAPPTGLGGATFASEPRRPPVQKMAFLTNWRYAG